MTPRQERTLKLGTALLPKRQFYQNSLICRGPGFGVQTTLYFEAAIGLGLPGTAPRGRGWGLPLPFGAK